MRSVWLVLAVLTVLASDASADRAGCACPTRFVVPERGMTDMPTNAKIWVIAPPEMYGKPRELTQPQDVRVIERTLQPNEQVVDDVLGVSFTTGSGRDDTPPAEPRIESLSLVTDERGDRVEITSLYAGAQVANDTALIRIDIKDGLNTVSLFTTPTHRFLCRPGVWVSSPTVMVEIRAIDYAGNESPPVAKLVDVTYSQHEPTCSDDFEHLRHGHGGIWMLLLGLYPVIIFGWLVFALVRRLLISRQPAEPLSYLHAAAVARRLLLRQRLWTAIVAAAMVVTGATVGLNIALLLLPSAISTLIQFGWKRRALKLLDRPGTEAARRGRWLVVTSQRDSLFVRASDRAFVAGKREAIPRSVAK